MSKIAYTQLVKNIADSYRNATGSSELVAVGELANKIEKAIASADTSNTQYKSITYNADNTITLIDRDDAAHIMTCVYEDNKITAITLDGEEIKLSYDSDSLITIENTVVNFDSILSDTDNTLYLNSNWYGYVGNVGGMDYNCSVSFYDDYVYFEKPIYSYGKFYLDNIPLKANCKTILTFTIFNLKEKFSFNFDCRSDYFSESLGIIENNDTYTIELPSVPVDSSFNIEIKSYKHLYDELAYFSIKDCYITYVPNDGDASNVGSGGSNISNIGDFQNGFIVGFTSKGKATQKTISCEASVAEVILPVNLDPATVEITNNNIEIETSVVLESEE